MDKKSKRSLKNNAFMYSFGATDSEYRPEILLNMVEEIASMGHW